MIWRANLIKGKNERRSIRKKRANVKYGYIYRAYNKINGLSYIGQAVHFQRRKKEHLRLKEDTYFHKSIKKYGKENFGWEIIFSDIPIFRLNEMEKKVILGYNTFRGPGYNSTPGGKAPAPGIDNPRSRKDVWNKKEEIIEQYLSGDSTRQVAITYKCDNNTIKLILESENIQIRPCKGNYGLKGELNPNYGKSPSLETRRKRSESLSGEKNYMFGKTGSQHHFYGKNHSLDSKEKMSQARKDYYKKQRIRNDKESGQLYWLPDLYEKD